MTMTPIRSRLAAGCARLLAPAAMFVPLVVLAQSPAPAPAGSAPAAPEAAKEAPAPAKDAAPDAAKDAPKEGAGDGAKDAPKAGAKSAPASTEAPPPTGPLAPVAWLAGCWRGEVNKREFREFWQPLRGNLMVGVSRNALPERTISFEYLRLETRADGVYYVSAPMGKNEMAFKLAPPTKDGSDDIFTFRRGGNEFPTTLTYRRAGGGWLYVEVAGQAQGKDHKVIYPFRRVDCETGEFLRR